MAHESLANSRHGNLEDDGEIDGSATEARSVTKESLLKPNEDVSVDATTVARSVTRESLPGTRNEIESASDEGNFGVHESPSDLHGRSHGPAFNEDASCSLYVSRAAGSPTLGHGGELLRSSLEKAILATEPTGAWSVSETSCGLIAIFAHESDAERLLQRGELARAFDGPVQVARFSARDSRYRQAALLRDVPWAIPLQDLSSALAKQGIAFGSIERSRQHVRVEVLDAGQYEALLRKGLDFFGAARFSAVPERWWRNGPGQPTISAGPGHQEALGGQQGDGVLQCYRCQGFWHVAANCRHLPRCVRCGEPHSVEFCPRPRNSPVCCHCSGPHHAGYRQCPVRLQLSNATPISITLSTARIPEACSPGKGSASQGHALRPNRF